MDTKKIQEAVKMIIGLVGEDGSREGLQKPQNALPRCTKEIFAGLNQTAESTYQNLLRLWTTIWSGGKDIFFHSMCEHHFLPFYGQGPHYPISQMGAWQAFLS